MSSAVLEFTTPPDEPEIRWRRVFRAPPALVFAAWTEPDRLCQWWGPRVLELVVCQIELRVGGHYRYVLLSPDGQEYALSGEYREIDPPRRLVTAWALESTPDDRAVETVVFAGLDGGTAVSSIIRHGSIAARDRNAGGDLMQRGWAETCLRLDEMLTVASRSLC